MKTGDRYIVKTESCIGKIEILFAGEYCIKVLWSTKIEQWYYKYDFKAPNKFLDPKIMILETIN